MDLICLPCASLFELTLVEPMSVLGFVFECPECGNSVLVTHTGVSPMQAYAVWLKANSKEESNDGD